MSYPIYKINIPNENIVLNFCLEEEMKSDNVNDKCMNMYIYGDDTIIEVINKIKIGLINHIEDFNEKKFEDISGYLTGQWTYYNDISKLKEYIYLNIFTKDTCSIEKLNEKIGLPNGLAAMGVTEDMIPNLVAHSMTDPSIMTTPRLPSQDEWEKLFLEARLSFYVVQW